MENKINIAELLKDCPKGMELYSPIFGKVYLDKIRPHLAIVVTTDKYKEEFLYDGRYGMNGECMLFPSKGKTTWEGFQRPFEDGDVIFTHANCLKVGLGNTWISIYKENRNGGVATYVDYAEDGSDYYSNIDGDKAFLCMEKDILRQRLATEEEKEKLFQAIKDNGYKWNEETKTLEKLPKFKVGDEIVKRNSITNSWIVSSVSSEYYGLKLHEGFEGVGVLPISEQDDYDLLLNTDKFYINTLIPFESRVLVRDNKLQKWSPAMWGYYDFDSQDYPYKLVGGAARYCIPYEKNEYLLGTTNDCDNFFKTW